MSLFFKRLRVYRMPPRIKSGFLQTIFPISSVPFVSCDNTRKTRKLSGFRKVYVRRRKPIRGKPMCEVEMLPNSMPT